MSEFSSAVPPLPKPAQWWVRLFFAALLLLGLAVFRDYGVSWDEPVDRLNGLVSARYVSELLAPGWAKRQMLLQSAPDFHSFIENDHGVLFELPLAFFDQLRPSTDTRTYYLARHLCVFLVCVAGTWALYRIARQRFQDWRLGLLAAALLVLSPRLFAESFYNGKDLVFLSVFTLAIFTLVRLLAQPTRRRAVLHGIATGAAVDMRVLGLLIVGLTLGMLLLEAWYNPAATPAFKRQLRRCGAVYGAAMIVAMIIGWPFLWSSPATNLWHAFRNMSHFRWEGTVFYLGNMVVATKLPWHYAPVWIVVTTPVQYTAAFVVGLLVTLAALARHWLAALHTFEGRLDVLFLGWVLVPLAMVIGLKSVIYDGWRHLYFIYPAFLLLAVRGAQAFWQATRVSLWRRRLAVAVAAAAALATVHTAVRMVRLHPHQQVYFSFLPNEKAQQLFELDYWALSYRQGLEYLQARHPTGRIRVNGPSPTVIANNLLLLSPAEQSRFDVEATGPGSYFLTGYRWHPEPYPPSTGREVYTVRPDGLRILSVFEQP